jgi:translocation and assembly module TamB
MRRAAKFLGAVLAALLLLLLAGFGLAQTGWGKRQILALIEGEVADPPARLQAQALEGLVPFDMTLIGATLSDTRGVWLSADRLSLAWSPSALLRGTFAVDRLQADVLRVERAPEAPPEASPTPSGPLLPQLPVAVDVADLRVARLELGVPLLGEPAVFTLAAKAHLGDPAQGLQADLDLHRIDQDRDRVTLALDYRPAADTLAVQAEANEPQGGLLTRGMGLSGAHALKLALNGTGPLRAWTAKGKATLDDRPLLDLEANSQGAPEARRVGFTLRLADLPMLPADLAPLVEGGVDAEGQVRLGSTSAILIDQLSVKTGAASLTARGTVDTAGPLDLTADLTLGDATPFASLLPPDLGWSGITGTLHLTGPMATPRATANGRITDLAYAGNRIGSATLDAAAALDTEAMRAQDVTASIGAADITSADPGLQPLLAEGATLDLSGALDQTGAISAQHLGLRAGAITLAAQGTAQDWGAGDISLSGSVAASDLAPALVLAGLTGGGSLDAQFKAARDPNGLSAELSATTDAFRSGIAPLDALLGTAPKLALVAQQVPDGTVTLQTASLESAGLSLGAEGTLSPDQDLSLRPKGRLADLGRLVSGAKGAVDFSGAITGKLSDPVARLQLGSDAIRFDRLTVARLQAVLDGTALRTAPKVDLRATAAVNDLPASLTASVAPRPERVELTGIAAKLASAGVTGKANIAGAAITGTFDLAAADLAPFSALAGAPLGGNLNGTLTLDAPKGRQNARLQLNGGDLRFDTLRAGKLALKASAADVLAAGPSLTATLNAEKLDLAGRAIDRATVQADGRLQYLGVTATAQGEGAKLDAAATVARENARMAITLSKLDLASDPVQAALQRPAEIVLAPGETQISHLALKANGGTLGLDARLAETGNMVALKVAKLPLSLLSLLAPDQKFLGTLDGTLDLDGPKSAPVARLKLQGTGLGVVGASAQLADLTLDGAWQGGRWQSQGRITLGKGNGLDLTAALPLPAGADGLPAPDMAAPLTARAKGELDLGLANAFIPGGADHVAGTADVDLGAGGTLGTPQLSGKATIRDGRYDNQRYGTRLRKLTAVIEGSGAGLRVASLSAVTPGGGTLSGDGQVDFAGAMPVTLAIRMNNARVLDAPIGTAVTDGALSLGGTLGEDLRLAGAVTIRKAEIRIPDKLPVDVEEIPVVEVNLPPEAAAARQADLSAPPPKTMKIALDLDVQAPQQVFVRGRGLDAELGGTLKIGGTADAPRIDGALKLRRGDFNLLSRRLTFDKGSITFGGERQVNPILDFTATTKLTDAEVTVTVSGTAAKPVIALTSSPALPQDEILARLLFGKASGALSPFEAVQLAQAMADLAGVSTGPNVLDKLRKGLGLDRLDIESGEGASSAPSLSAGRYVAPGVFVGAKQGAAANSSAATVEIELSPNVKLESEVGADANSKAGINLEWNY